MPKAAYIIATVIVIAGVVILMIRRKMKVYEVPHQNRITIKGDAVTINGEAAVRTDNAGIYFIKGMQTWEKEWIGHRVMAIGDMEARRDNDKQFIGSAVLQLLDE